MDLQCSSYQFNWGHIGIAMRDPETCCLKRLWSSQLYWTGRSESALHNVWVCCCCYLECVEWYRLTLFIRSQLGLTSMEGFCHAKHYDESPSHLFLVGQCDEMNSPYYRLVQRCKANGIWYSLDRVIYFSKTRNMCGINHMQPWAKTPIFSRKIVLCTMGQGSKRRHSTLVPTHSGHNDGTGTVNYILFVV